MKTNNKLREALAGLIDGICFHCDLSEDCKGVPCEKLQNAKAALAAPRRNCDVGTAEEQYSRMLRRCYEWMCIDCKQSDKDFRKCALSWAQMPYEEGETDEQK